MTRFWRLPHSCQRACCSSLQRWQTPTVTHADTGFALRLLAKTEHHSPCPSRAPANSSSHLSSLVMHNTYPANKLVHWCVFCSSSLSVSARVRRMSRKELREFEGKEVASKAGSGAQTSAVIATTQNRMFVHTWISSAAQRKKRCLSRRAHRTQAEDARKTATEATRTSTPSATFSPYEDSKCDSPSLPKKKNEAQNQNAHRRYSQSHLQHPWRLIRSDGQNLLDHDPPKTLRATFESVHLAKQRSKTNDAYLLRAWLEDRKTLMQKCCGRVSVKSKNLMHTCCGTWKLVAERVSGVKKLDAHLLRASFWVQKTRCKLAAGRASGVQTV